jgi:hypothetical protein
MSGAVLGLDWPTAMLLGQARGVPPSVLAELLPVCELGVLVEPPDADAPEEVD